MDVAKEHVVRQLKALRPAFLAKKPHFNFISAHCEQRPMPSLSPGYPNCH